MGRCSYALIPFSFIYFLIVSLRNFFYRLHIFKEHRLDARVISVGNITWGGTGKTPLTVLIAEALSKKGQKPAILIRGYGRDEPELLSRLLTGVPVAVGRDRVKKGREAIAMHSVDTLLLDDGFQHRRIKRDLDIVCIDATDPFGNGWLIPAGSMREGLTSLKRADIFLITKADLVQDQKALEALEKRLKKINPEAIIVKSIHRPELFYKLSNEQLVDIESLKHKDIALVSAIGNPSAFEKTILNLGLKFKKHFIFRDHHWYRNKDLEKINGYCSRNGIDSVITTEKDAVRLRITPVRRNLGEGGTGESRTTNIFVLRIKLEITENEQGFHKRLFRIHNS